MEEMIFEVSPLNPLSFNGDLPDWYYFEHAKHKCYYQKFQTNDNTIIQVLTESESFTARIIDFETNLVVSTLTPQEIDTNIIGHDFKAYNIQILFSSLPEGYYYINLTWNDSGEKNLYSEPIHVLNEHTKTLLFEYRNSENNFSVVFTEETVFSLRVEGTIQDFTPSSDDEIYNDQRRNSTLLDSVPYRIFRLYIGNAPGIPDWMADKANRIMSCDMVKIDGHYFNKEEGATWEMNRQDEYPFSGMSIEVQPIDNRFMDRLITQDDSDGAEPLRKVLLRKSTNFLNQGGDFQVNNIFKDKTLLDYITVYRNSGSPYTLLVGLTPNGKEIGEFYIEDASHTQTIRWAFNIPSVLYLSGMTGSSDFHIVYEQLNEEGGGEGGGGGVPIPYPQLGRGAVVIYEGEAADLDADFDTSTGLGREDTDWYGFAICDGRNGTLNMAGRFPLGWSGTDRPGDTGGVARVTLTESQIPVITPRWRFSNGQLNGVSGTSRMKAYTDPSYGNQRAANINTSPITSFGGGQSHENMPPYIVSIFVKKIL